MNDFLIGLAAGVFIGFMALLVISLMVTASQADEALERYLDDERIDLPVPPRDER